MSIYEQLTSPTPAPVTEPDMEPVTESGKSLANSKTIWFNALTTAGAILTYLVDSSVFEDYPQLTAGILFAYGVVNIVLRILTGEPIKIKDKTGEK